MTAVAAVIGAALCAVAAYGLAVYDGPAAAGFILAGAGGVVCLMLALVALILDLGHR